MKNKKLISILMVFAITVALSACKRPDGSVINTTKALYVKESFKISTQTEKTEMKGRVIRFNDTNKKSNFGPSFEFEKLTIN